MKAERGHSNGTTHRKITDLVTELLESVLVDIGDCLLGSHHAHLNVLATGLNDLKKR